MKKKTKLKIKKKPKFKPNATATESLVCCSCGQEIDNCDNCYSSFYDGDEIFCDGYGNHTCCEEGEDEDD